MCDHLGMPLHEADFVEQYWHRVFAPFLEQYAAGLTPNPDLACNRAIKFDALLHKAAQLGGEVLATGHYARLQRDQTGVLDACRHVRIVIICMCRTEHQVTMNCFHIVTRYASSR